MDKFDFDDWALLYRHDPAAFEARRQAVLALELAKVDPKVAEPARNALRRLEGQLACKDDAARIQTSMIWMAASMKLLSLRMQDLGESIDRARNTIT
jgi:hypothetical protein